MFFIYNYGVFDNSRVADYKLTLRSPIFVVISAETIKCYECSSVLDGNCNDAFTATGITQRTCSGSCYVSVMRSGYVITPISVVTCQQYVGAYVIM